MKRLLPAFVASLALASVALADLGPSALHPDQVRIRFAATSSHVRVPLPEPVLERAGSRLEHLRLVDERGRDVPFVVAGTPYAAAEESLSAPVVPTEAAQTMTPGDVPVFEETYEVPVVAGPRGRPVAIDLGILDAEFTATIELADARGRSLGRHSAFRLRDGSTRTRFALPAATGDSLRIQVRSNRGYLSPSIRFVHAAPPSHVAQLELEPEVAPGEGQHEGAFVVRLPPAYVANALEVTGVVSGARVSVDIDGTGGEPLEIADAMADGDAVRLQLPALVGVELRLRVSPRGATPTVRLLVQSPALVFDGAGVDSARIVFGGIRDRGRAPTDSPELRAATLDGRLPLGECSAVEHNPDYREPPLLRDVSSAGAMVERERYRYVASLDVPSSPDGLVRLTLPLPMVAVVHDGLPDLRIVDGAGRQRPFLLEGATQVATPLRRVGTSTGGGRTRYDYALREPGLTVRALRIDPGVPVVDRAVVVYSLEDEDHPVQIGQGKLLRGQASAAPVEISLVPVPLSRLRIEVQDGDEAPLSLRVEAVADAPRLAVLAEAGRYDVLFGAQGDDEHRPPTYDARLREALIELLDSPTVRIAPMRPNPDADPPSMFSKKRVVDVALYSVLALATLALFVLTFRLVRAEDQGGPSGPD